MVVKKRKKATSKDIYMKVASNIWPMERDLLYRPDRMKYVRKLIKTDGCVFCQARDLKMSFDSLCVYKNTNAMIVVNKFPYNSGHLLILPQRHCGDLLELSDLEYRDVNEALRMAMKALNVLYKPAGMNIGLNHGAVAGAGIPEHLHYHIVPRWSGDVNFFPMIAETKVLVENLEQTYARVYEYFLGYNKLTKAGS